MLLLLLPVPCVCQRGAAVQGTAPMRLRAHALRAYSLGARHTHAHARTLAPTHPRIHTHPRAAVTPDGAGMTHGAAINIAMAVTMADGGLITPVLKVRARLCSAAAPAIAVAVVVAMAVAAATAAAPLR